MEACYPRDEQRKELLADLLKLVANEDNKTIHLLLGILVQVKRLVG
jgi:hypothetical protein